MRGDSYGSQQGIKQDIFEGRGGRRGVRGEYGWEGEGEFRRALGFEGKGKGRWERR